MHCIPSCPSLPSSSKMLTGTCVLKATKRRTIFHLVFGLQSLELFNEVVAKVKYFQVSQ